jgi:hypothetical protein
MCQTKVSDHNCMPMVECPSCHRDFQIDDYYDFHGDNEERECPNCNTVLYCTYVETVMYATFQTKPEK